MYTVRFLNTDLAFILVSPIDSQGLKKKYNLSWKLLKCKIN